MAPKKKYKRLTNAEKAENKRIKAMLRDEGLIPAAKPRLNRKVFIRETYERWNSEGRSLNDFGYLIQAIGIMLPVYEGGVVLNPTPEAVGVSKVLRIAMDIKQFEKELKESGETTYNLIDMYKNVIEPIINL